MNDNKVCKRCVMNNTVEDITFNEFGVCNYCDYFDKEVIKYWFPSKIGEEILEDKIEKIKKNSSKNKYHAIIGLSGGLDSSYLALFIRKFNLSILAVHVDAGWNSESAVNNINKLVNYCNFDLYTHVADWDTMRRLQLAYLRSGVANQDVPQDHIFYSTLYKIAKKEGIKFILSGGNMTTESIFPNYWHADAMDWINIKSIFKAHGVGNLKKYNHINFWVKNVVSVFRKIEELRPLDYINYKTVESAKELEKIGWKSYGSKHNESIFTKFFQNYYLPQRFGYDKRIAHFSSRVLTGDLSRNEAIELLKQPLYEENDLNQDLRFISKKLEISIDELNSFISEVPKRNYNEYRNSKKQEIFLRNLILKLKKNRLLMYFIKKYLAIN